MTIIDAIFNRIASGIELLNSAAAVSHAVETGHAPKAINLRALGIDPRAFANIGHG